MCDFVVKRSLKHWRLVGDVGSKVCVVGWELVSGVEVGVMGW